MVLPPEIRESAESETFYIEKILHSPYCGKLHRNLTVRPASISILVIRDIFTENLQVQCVLEILAVEKPVKTAKESMIDFIVLIYTAVILDMNAERCKFAVLPEIQAAGNLEIGAAWRFLDI